MIYSSSAVIDHGSQVTGISHSGLFSRYFDGKAFLELPIPMDSKVFSQITIGAWVRPTTTESVTSQNRFVLQFRCIRLIYGFI